MEQLSESFDEDPRIFEEDGEYYLWSSQFNQLCESSEASDAAKDIVRNVRNLGELGSLRVEGLDTYCVVEIQEDGSERRIVHASGSATAIAMGSARTSVDGQESPPRAESTYEYTQLALEDNKVQELIQLRDNGDDWVNLYRIYECIKNNIKSEGDAVAQGWWTSTEKNRFTCTANDPDAIGHEARHAGDPDASVEEMNDEQMSHPDAKSLIDSLINDWLSHRKEVLESSGDES